VNAVVSRDDAIPRLETVRGHPTQFMKGDPLHAIQLASLRRIQSEGKIVLSKASGLPIGSSDGNSKVDQRNGVKGSTLSLGGCTQVTDDYS